MISVEAQVTSMVSVEMVCLAQTVTGVLDALLPYSSALLTIPVYAIKVCGSENLLPSDRSVKSGNSPQ